MTLPTRRWPDWGHYVVARSSRRAACGIAIIATVLGCGPTDGITRVVVTGKVRLNGEPVVKGQIRFVPEVGTKGSVTIEDIKDGSYACRQLGGVPVGEHRVEILGWDPSVPFSFGPGQKAPQQLVPAKYNEESELRVMLDGSKDPVDQDFDLERSGQTTAAENN